jgi:septum formation protein
MLSLLKNLDTFDIILASASPRRFELLKMIGMDFKVRPSHVDEVYQAHLSPGEYVIENAKKKGHAIADKFPDSLVISADTVVVYKDKILEKPEDEKHAMKIIKTLSNRTHQVLTGFGFIIKSSNREIFKIESSMVTFRNLSQAEIRAYINTGESFDKAGGYGAQGQGSLLIKRIDGCFYNVVGLPLSSFFSTLNQFLIES